MDKALASEEWNKMNPNYQVDHLPRYTSDHSLIKIMTAQIDSDLTSQKWQTEFKFDRTWMQPGVLRRLSRGRGSR